MEKESPSSFEKEFNRLSFLASIATGANDDQNSNPSVTKDTSQPSTNSPQIQSAAQLFSNFNGNMPSQKVIVPVNGLENNTSKGLDIEKINKILNSNAQINNQQPSIYQNAMRQGSKTTLGMNTTLKNNNLLVATQSVATPSALISTPVTKPIVTQTVAAIQPSITEQQKIFQKKLTGVTAMPPIVTMQTPTPVSNIHTLNPPLIISSSPQKTQEQTNGGQTIFLPANFAGILNVYFVYYC